MSGADITEHHVEVTQSTSYVYLTPLCVQFCARTYIQPAFLYFGTCCWCTPQGFGRTSATRNSCFLGNMKTVGWRQGSPNKPFRRLKATAHWKRFSHSMEAKADGKTDSGRLPARLPGNFLKLLFTLVPYANLMGSLAGKFTPRLFD